MANSMDATEIEKVAPCYTILNIFRENTRKDKDGGHSTISRIFVPAIIKLAISNSNCEPTKFGSGLPYSTLRLKCRPRGVTY